ncbi:Small subunit (SSU) processome component [Leucoagaricus gongylophorus]
MNKRYNESSIAIGSGVELGHDENMDETIVRDIDGDLRVGHAELSLGQRLATVVDAGAHRSSDSEDGGDNPTKSRSVKKKSKAELHVVPANSLTRTLIQALHSADTRLTETCLAHSNADLIRNTVKRLPPQLAIPLLNACVERLGRGARGQNMKGGGGGASAQRGMTMVTWIKTVLTVHTGHLMTVPDLVARLSGLHATLTARLALQERLLSLSGKLDMVLSQIEMRSAVAPTPLAPKNGKLSSRVKKSNVKHYIEGESDTSDAQTDVEIEIGDEEGSMENVELGGDSDDKDEDGEDEDDDNEDDDDDEGSLNDFIDDEAEEYSDEDEDDDEETE